ncbi:Cd2+/Zn2+-exporting ATPase [Clostridiales Family XIII bacterium PM5-7]
MNKTQKIDLGKIIISAALFATGIATNIIWFYIAAYAIAGYKTIFEAALNIIHGHVLDENFLMTIASLGAVYCQEYPEAVAVMLFYQVGEFFEHYAVNNSRKSIADLMDIKAEFANKLVDGKEVTVDPEDLTLDDMILIRPGEKVPVDGIIIDGSSSLNTSALTGESVPRDVTAGEEIISGTINLTGALTVQVTKLFEDSTVAKVLDLVENAGSRKASVEKFITRFARYYTPIVVAFAVLMAIVPPLAIPGQAFQDWLYRAMIFLVISCPCALVISVPLSLFAGVGSASKQGILVKGSNYLEALARVNTFAFDKTGTLTTGKFQVTVIHPVGQISEEALLELAAYGESLSNHPIATSIVSRYGSVDSGQVTEYAELSGKGITGVYKGKKLYCGNDKLMKDLGLSWINPSEVGSVVHLATDTDYLGYIIVADTLRDNSASTIDALKDLGVSQTIMLTGDRKEIAQSVASELAITDVLSELLPEDKVTALESVLDEKTEGHLAFVGDGINDAPVLARADVGIAMGAFGSDAAIEAADVVIMTDDISKLVTMKKIATKTLRISKQNVVFALTVKAIILGLGAFGMANMWEAVFADVGVSFIAILNAMRALKL